MLDLGDDSTKHRPRQPGLPLKLSNSGTQPQYYHSSPRHIPLPYTHFSTHSAPTESFVVPSHLPRFMQMRAESVVALICRASTESAARHADDIRDIVLAEREEMRRQLQAEREEARAAKEALEQQVLVERKRADDELVRVRAELDHERQQRDHDEEMRREAETQRILECDEETKQQLYNITDLLLAEREGRQLRLERDEERSQQRLEIDEETRQQLNEITDLLLAHREEFMRKKEVVDERWESSLAWRDEINRQFDGLFNLVQGIMDSYAEEKERDALRRRSDSSEAHERSAQ